MLLESVNKIYSILKLSSKKSSLQYNKRSLLFFAHTCNCNLKSLFYTDKITVTLSHNVGYWLLLELVNISISRFYLPYKISHTHFLIQTRSILKGTILRQHYQQLDPAHAHPSLLSPPPLCVEGDEDRTDGAPNKKSSYVLLLLPNGDREWETWKL